MISTSAETNSPAHDLSRKLSRAIQGEVRFDPYTKAMYSTDASIYSMEPMGVVLPRSTADVQAIVETVRAAGVSLLPRGGGTSLSGQTVNTGVVADFSKYMHNIIEINPEEQWVRTQPGVTIDELNRQLKPYGLFFTTDPSTSSRANIGGAIGNNSCGTHSIVYGKTSDHVLELETVLSDGTLTLFKETGGAALEKKISTSGLEGAIYKTVRKVSESSRDEVERRFPKILRRVGGYNLDLVDTPAPNLSKLLVGSEGTLASIVSAKLHLEPIPKAVAVAVLHFRSLREAMDACVSTLQHNPYSVEHVGEMIISQAKRSLGFGRILDFLQGEPSDILVVEMTGDTLEHAEERCRTVEKYILKNKMGYASTILVKPHDKNKVKAMRQAGLGLLMNIPGDSKPVAFVEDTAVPPERLPEYVERFDEIVRRNGTEAGYYGHASVGCMHIRPTVNLKTREGLDRMFRISEEISDLVLEFGGSLTGEHGDGIVRGYWAEKMYGGELIRGFKEIKKAFDPQGLMNPGKIFDTPPLTDNLRYGMEYRIQSPDTTGLDFNRDGGFAAAVEKCNGVGACRKLNAGAMCPSYMATREEEHSTRGRANALRVALSGAIPQMDPYSHRMLDVLDLCLECKSCKSECPSNVDMAKIKYEFLYQYYKKGHKVPLRSRLVADIHKLSLIACGPHAGLVNAVLRSPIARFSQQAIGLHRRRSLPKFASRSFDSWFNARKPRGAGKRGKVVFFSDTFTNFNHPQAGIAAVRILEMLDYEPVIVPRRCCGRPMISKGLLDRAAEHARYNVDLLYPHVKNGAKIVGIEASCLGALMDEYPDLLPNDKRAREVAAAAMMLEEVLLQDLQEGRIINWTDKKKSVKLLVHCHQKALRGTAAPLAALKMPPRYDAEIIDAGCCGMAGSFGFEKEHYDISMRIGEDRLFPSVRSMLESDEIAITGVSCKQQIEDGTARSSRYISEILADALPLP